MPLLRLCLLSLVVVATSCGTGDSARTFAEGARITTSEVPRTTAGGTIPSTMPTTAATPASTTTKTATHGDAATAELCTLANRQMKELPAKMDALVAAEETNEAWLAYASEEEANNNAIGKLVPAELQPTYATTLGASNLIIKAIRDSEGDATMIILSLTSVGKLVASADFQAAALAWGTYLKTTCSLDVTTLTKG